MNRINIQDRSFIVKAVVKDDNISDELREQLKVKYNVKTVLKDNSNNLLFVDEIINANIISEVNNEV